jgi:lysophospholipase L1-like esterase
VKSRRNSAIVRTTTASLAVVATSIGLAAGASNAAPPRLRPPANPTTLVAIGDSVAAGMGLQWQDWLRPDDCWRAGSSSYGGRVFDKWRKAAPSNQRNAYKFALLACKGETAAGLGGGGETNPNQIDAAIAADPGLITLTIGANDLGFVHPERFFDANGKLTTTSIDKAMRALRMGLTADLRQLVDKTSAAIIVTTYHNPTAADPIGVAGCRGKCFASAVSTVLDTLNATITNTADGFSRDRVRVADVTSRFAGHGAPNGWGVDALRQAGVPGWVPIPDMARGVLSEARGIQSYCSSNHNIWNDKNYVNGIDCVHPNGDGAGAYADAVWDVWQNWAN